MLQNILGALGTCLDAMSAVILSLSYGFATMPTAFAFLFAGIGMLATGQVSPVCIPSELIILINRYTKDNRERSSAVLFAGLIIAGLGLSGAMGRIVTFIGPGIVSGVMAGVGIMIFRVSVDLISEQPLPGTVSLAIAFIIYLSTEDLIYTLLACVLGATLVWNIFKRDYIRSLPKADLTKEKIKFSLPVFNFTVLRCMLGCLTLMFGGILSDGTITAQLAGIEPNSNAMCVYDGIGNALSGLFGGAPVGTIVSGTATAPDPLLSGVFFMFFMALILLLKVVPKIKNHIPAQGLAGFLFVLSTLVIFPPNVASALTENPYVGSVTALVTGFVDPFLGMCSGILMRFLMGILHIG